MKKKILSLGVIAVLIIMLFALTGCGEDTKSNTENKASKMCDRTGLKVGDYVSYEYDETGDYILKADVSGWEVDQTIKQTDLLWKILYIDEETGRVDLISNTSKDEKIYFADAKGYNNGVYLINDICKKLYSNKELGITARSIKIEDIENLFNEDGKEEKLTSGSVKYGEIKNYKEDNNYYPNLYAKENGSGIDNTEIKKDGIGISDINDLMTDTYSQANSNGLTVTHSSYRMDNPSSSFGNSEVYSMLFKEGSYWVASRSAMCGEKWATFGIMRVQQYAQRDVYLGNQVLFNSNLEISGTYGESGIRPIVSIDGNTEIIINDGTISDMHSIKK